MTPRRPGAIAAPGVALVVLAIACGGSVVPAAPATPAPPLPMAGVAPWVAGTWYAGESGHVEYLAGNLPVILSAPHGGDRSPPSIPDRRCAACETENDLGTQEVARLVADALHGRLGRWPHVVINRLARRKLDANREETEGASGNAAAARAWADYHGLIDSARARVASRFGKGLLLDVHGHAHDIQRIEVGMLVTGDSLRLADDRLAPVAAASSLRHLARSSRGGLDFPALLRGPSSLGGLLEAAGYAAVPAPGAPAPRASEPYFDGGYTTWRHGSRSAGTIDAAQLELPWAGVRDGGARRRRFADSLAVVIERYLLTHYFAPIPP
ncbi:MAG: hypothetical protein HYX65_07195 [Gemmatimonadetes bacterium]|nr:hypothetical protein [Gemmatimonadota bacterium]